MGFDKAGIERGCFLIGGKRGIELPQIFERIAEVWMRLRKVWRQNDRLARRGERSLFVPPRAADRGKVRHGLDIIRLGGKRLFDQHWCCRVIAPLMCDQPEMVQADGVIRLRARIWT
jgi:hypothetical protein